MAAPKVTLSSRPIVQRHVNAYLLAALMREWPVILSECR